MYWVEADRCGKPTEFTRDTYLLLWWYVRQSESLTVESTVPRPFKPTEFIRGTDLLLWWYVRQSDSLTFESTVPRPLSLVARSRPLTQPLQSLYPVCMYSGKRH